MPFFVKLRAWAAYFLAEQLALQILASSGNNGILGIILAAQEDRVHAG